MSGQALLRFELIGGTIAPAELVTVDERCTNHADCIRVIRADGKPAWASGSEIEVLP